MSRRITILPGDGIGPEVVGPACELLSAAARQAGEDWTLEIAPIGGAAIDETGGVRELHGTYIDHDEIYSRTRVLTRHRTARELGLV